MDDYDDLASTTYDWNFDFDQGNFDLTGTGIASTTVEEIPKAADENFPWNILDDYDVDSCTFGIAGTPIASTTSKEKPKADEHRANTEKIVPSLDSCTFGIAGTPIASTTSKEKPKADEHRATTGKIIPSLVFPAWVESAPDEDQRSF